MKRLFRFWCILAVVLLFAAEASAATSKLLRVTDPERNLGEVREADGKVEVVFEFENIADRPVVVTQVRSTCSCAVAEYDRRALEPGSRGRVRVVFDPADLSGDFSKSLVIVADNGSYRRFSTLTLKGRVVSRIPELVREFPCELSSGLRSDRTEVGMRQISPVGLSPERTMSVVNTAAHGIALTARCDCKHVVVFMPDSLQAEESAVIRFRIDPSGMAPGPFGCEVRFAADGVPADTPVWIKGAVEQP